MQIGRSTFEMRPTGVSIARENKKPFVKPVRTLEEKLSRQAAAVYKQKRALLRVHEEFAQC